MIATHHETTRLNLSPLTPDDTSFIKELVNSPEWIRFIGQRNINTEEEAKEYIHKIIYNPDVNYWVVRLKEENMPIGVITFIKRDYLDHHDIGFAFLSKFSKKGYAYEASKVVLDELMKDDKHKEILATTVKDNVNSIKLLEKLGLRYNRQIRVKDDDLLVYSASTDKLQINEITQEFFSLFNNVKGNKTDWKMINYICFPQTIIIKKNNDKEEVYNLNGFLEPRKIILSDGTLKDFEEYESSEETKIIGNIAQRFSKYEKKGYLHGEYFEGKGNKFFQFVKTGQGWKINSIIWEDEP
jgi:RimJ/RimL family protein N-acetyltransferase